MIWGVVDEIQQGSGKEQEVIFFGVDMDGLID